MKKIFFAFLGLTASLVVADIGVCQQNCAIDYGKCLIQTFDMETCSKNEAACALDCLKGAQVAESHHSHHHSHHSPAVSQSNIEVCQKNCALDTAKCLIQTFDAESCFKQEAVCALDCLKGVEFVAKWNEAVVPYVESSEKAGDQGTCQKNCAIDVGKCLITTGNVEQCLKDEAACALDCLKSVQSSVPVSASGEVCQQNCAIDYGKCLI